MDVARNLGFNADGTGGALLTAAARHWDAWAREDPVLEEVEGGVEGLRRFTRGSPPEQVDAVLQALARRAAVDGGDDANAGVVLSWCLLPGACRLAQRLLTLGGSVNDAVASQLWIEVRSFESGRGKVAANILARTRNGVLEQLGARSRLLRTDKTWAHTMLVEPGWPFWEDDALFGRRAMAQSRAAARDNVNELFDLGVQRGVIDQEQVKLLRALMFEADQRVAMTRRGRGGLMTPTAATDVGRRMGLSEATVRRRARIAVRSLTAAFAPAGEDRPA